MFVSNIINEYFPKKIVKTVKTEYKTINYINKNEYGTKDHYRCDGTLIGSSLNVFLSTDKHIEYWIWNIEYGTSNTEYRISNTELSNVEHRLGWYNFKQMGKASEEQVTSQHRKVISI